MDNDIKPIRHHDSSQRPLRHEFTSRIRFVIQSQGEIYDRYAHNLSEGGIFIRDDNPPAIGSIVLIEFVLPNGQALCRAAARVVHAKPATAAGEKTAGMGLAFVEMDAVAQAISKFFKQKNPDTTANPPEAEVAVEQSLSIHIKNDRKPGFNLSGPIVGIDLGTVNSCIAIVKNGIPRVITSVRGYEIVPSIVFVNPDQSIVVGHPARERMILNPERAIYGSKRFLGRPFASAEVRQMAHFFNYEIVSGPDGRAAALISDSVIRLEQVAAHILKSLKDMAEQTLGTPLQRAVISIPAYFGETQREAIREAGKLAGFYVERILNEPTAAAVAYGFGRSLKRTLLVYDLGGGTFDTTVLRVEDDTFTVLATEGDPFLGGADFDDRLTEFVLSNFERTHKINLRDDPVAIQRIRFAAELAKQQLSVSESTNIHLPCIRQTELMPIDLHMTFERSMFISLTQDLVNRTMTIVEQVLKNAKLQSGQLDDIILVGGQTRSLHVRKNIMDRFNKKPSTYIHPDEAVALGAAIVADSMYQDKSVQLKDVLPASIRMCLPDSRTQLLLAKGTSLPAQRRWSLASAGTEPVILRFCRGEEDLSIQNTPLGSLTLAGIKYAKETKWHITLLVDEEGLLQLTVENPNTKEAKLMRASLTD